MTNIAEALQDLTWPVAELTLHPQNYRQGDVANIASSLERFGQVRPILVQESTGHIVAGNHTFKAALSLGWDHVAAVRVPMSDEEAEAYLVADNRASDKAVNDEALLAPILERLMLAGRLAGTGYSPDDVDDMLSAMDALPEVDLGNYVGGDVAPDAGLAEKFANREPVAMRQFVLMYDQETATEVERMFRQLERAWGVSGVRNVVLESLRRTVAGLDGAEAQAATEAGLEDAAEATPNTTDTAATNYAPPVVDTAGEALTTEGVPPVTQEQVDRIDEVLGTSPVTTPMTQDEFDAASPVPTTTAHGSTEGAFATVGDGGPVGAVPTALEGDLSAPLDSAAEGDDDAGAV